MTDENQPDDEGEPETYSPNEITVNIAGKSFEVKSFSWDVEDEDADSVGLYPQTPFPPLPTPTVTLNSPATIELSGDLTVTHSDGTATAYEDVRIQFKERTRKEAEQLREQAPEDCSLADQTTDIDELINALQVAKSEGVEQIYVNDDGAARAPNPRLTNNFARYYGTGPKPESLDEWVEL